MVAIQRERVPLIGVGPETFTGCGPGISEATKAIRGPAGQSLGRVPPQDDLHAVRITTECVCPRGSWRSRLNRAVRRQPRLEIRSPQHVGLTASVDGDEEVCLMANRPIEPGVHVQRPLRSQAGAGVESVNVLEIGELAIHAAAGAHPRVCPGTELESGPWRSGGCIGERPTVDTAAG